MLIFIFTYQIEQNRKMLFSILLALSVNTIPEEEIDYILDSSSDEISVNIPSVLSDTSSEEFIISDESKINLNLDLVSNNKTWSSKGVQNLPDTVDTGIQTQSSNFERVVTANLNSDLRTKADLLEFGTEINNILPDKKELINKAVQTKPDLHIDLSSTSFDVTKEVTAKSVLDVLPHNIDPLLLEAYIVDHNLVDTYHALSMINGCIW